MSEDRCGWRVLLHQFYEFVSLPANKLVNRVLLPMKGDNEQNEFVSSTTYNNNNKINSIQQIIEFVSSPTYKLFVSAPTNKLSQFIALLALFCNEELQLLREKESVARLLCILLEKHAVFLNSSEIRTYYQHKVKSRRPSWWILYNQDADNLIALGFAEKRDLHPDAANQPLGPGRKPLILCLKGCPESTWRAVSLDAVNWRQGHRDEDVWSEVPAPTEPDEALLLGASLSPQEQEYHRKYGMPKKSRKKSDPEASPATSREFIVFKRKDVEE